MRVFRREVLRKVPRSYGSLTVLASPKETAQAVRRTDVKTLELQPGTRTSNHYHLLSESVFWVVRGEVDALSGDGSVLHLTAGDVLVVPPREKHCLVHRGSAVAEIVETQSPPYATWDTFPNEKSCETTTTHYRKGRFWEASTSIRAKVCGIRNLEAAQICAECGVAAVGLNLTYGSKGLRALDQWLEWIPYIPSTLNVFVLTDSCLFEEIELLIKLCQADTVQLQGPMPIESVREIAAKCRERGTRVVKSLGLEHEHESSIIYYADAIQDSLDALLIDSSWSGGTGKRANSEKLRNLVAEARVPVILAGGLTSDNVVAAIRDTGVTAVDVESGVEVRMGTQDGGLRGIAVKSPDRVREFMDAIKRAGMAGI